MQSVGRFIVVEGIEGAGKSSAMQVIEQEIITAGHAAPLLTREPGGTPIAEQLRLLLKQTDKDEPLTIQAEVMLMFASRVQLIERRVKPALKRGQWVLADRHNLSSYAYQGAGRGVSIELLNQLTAFCLADFTPCLTFYLDVPAEQGMLRVNARGDKDRIEQEPLSFFKRVRDAYLDAAKANPTIKIIDASQTMAEVHLAIRHHLAQFLAGI